MNAFYPAMEEIVATFARAIHFLSLIVHGNLLPCEISKMPTRKILFPSATAELGERDEWLPQTSETSATLEETPATETPEPPTTEWPETTESSSTLEVPPLNETPEPENHQEQIILSYECEYFEKNKVHLGHNYLYASPESVKSGAKIHKNVPTYMHPTLSSQKKIHVKDEHKCRKDVSKTPHPDCMLGKKAFSMSSSVPSYLRSTYSSERKVKKVEKEKSDPIPARRETHASSLSNMTKRGVRYARTYKIPSSTTVPTPADARSLASSESVKSGAQFHKNVPRYMHPTLSSQKKIHVNDEHKCRKDVSKTPHPDCILRKKAFSMSSSVPSYLRSTLSSERKVKKLVKEKSDPIPETLASSLSNMTKRGVCYARTFRTPSSISVPTPADARSFASSEIVKSGAKFHKNVPRYMHPTLSSQNKIHVKDETMKKTENKKNTNKWI
jgi:hypothetical protein